jgi:hypothetical protein
MSQFILKYVFELDVNGNFQKKYADVAALDISLNIAVGLNMVFLQRQSACLTQGMRSCRCVPAIMDERQTCKCYLRHFRKSE